MHVMYKLLILSITTSYILAYKILWNYVILGQIMYVTMLCDYVTHEQNTYHANNCFLLGFSSPVSCLHTTVDSCTFQLLSQTDAQELLRQICTSPSLIVQPPASRTSPCVQVNSAGKCIRIASQISSRCFVQCSKQILYYI